jgi:uracil-DNA glycosylase family 4
MIVGEAWGQEELNQRQPFRGESGRELDKMLAEAGIDRRECLCTNIIADRPPGNDLYKWFIPTAEAKKTGTPVNGLYPSPQIAAGLATLYNQVDAVRPSLIIGCGNYPFWAFSTNVRIANSSDPSGWKVPTGITSWRGSQLWTDLGPRRTPFLPILHPASILRNWPTRPVTVHDLRTRVPLALGGKWNRPQRLYKAPPTFVETTAYLSRLAAKLSRGPTPIVIDLETKARRHITCIGMTHDGVEAISIPFLLPRQDRFDSHWSFAEEGRIVRLLRLCLNHHNAQLIGQNFLYDTQYMALQWHIRPRAYFDTMVAQHVMFPGTPKALGYLASLYCKNFYCFWKEDSKEWEEEGDLALHLTYNCDDCIYTWQVWQAQRDALVRMGMQEQFLFKMEEWKLAFEMMERGVLIDQKARAEMSFSVMEEAAKRQRWLNDRIPEWVRPPTKKGAKPWYSSAQQQMRLFYEVLGLKTVHHRKTGRLTIDDSALDDIAHRYPELKRLVNTIAELRSLGVFQNNFLSAALDPDGRMRCSFNVAGPETFRWSSSENAFGRGTNLQNIPTGIIRKGR